MRKGIIAIFLFTGLFSLAFSRSQAETIKFLIEDSPYYVRQDLVIKEEQTFTVEPGVVIEMAKGAGIIIEGRIDISGYPRGGEVIFKAVGPPQNYHKGFWRGIIIKSKEKNAIQYAVIQHSKIGIELAKGSCVNLNNNIITQNKTGIRAEGVKEFSIVRNSFLGNFIDIEIIDSAGSVEKNYFEGSLTCLRLKQGYPRIQRNFFKQAYKNIIESYNESELQAGENWWGSADEELIKNRISQRGKGKFIFKPYLLEPPDLKEVGVDLKNSCTSCR
ncbi:MAG TPA: hypothetical protein ENI31_00595 [Candidatus Omnitrophica bacterium]|nr:hypothetical protein [Candidatus Omnitrophota bacterium]